MMTIIAYYDNRHSQGGRVVAVGSKQRDDRGTAALLAKACKARPLARSWRPPARRAARSITISPAARTTGSGRTRRGERAGDASSTPARAAGAGSRRSFFAIWRNVLALPIRGLRDGGGDGRRRNAGPDRQPPPRSSAPGATSLRRCSSKAASPKWNFYTAWPRRLSRRRKARWCWRAPSERAFAPFDLVAAALVAPGQVGDPKEEDEERLAFARRRYVEPLQRLPELAQIGPGLAFGGGGAQQIGGMEHRQGRMVRRRRRIFAPAPRARVMPSFAPTASGSPSRRGRPGDGASHERDLPADERQTDLRLLRRRRPISRRPPRHDIGDIDLACGRARSRPACGRAIGRRGRRTAGRCGLRRRRAPRRPA